jgi:NAD(P)-dependent dehydrogenase (short-subunit alcohol dehydrogenase family)
MPDVPENRRLLRTLPIPTRPGGFVLGLVLVSMLLPARGVQGQDGASGAESQDRVVLVTGSTSGLGREVALRLASSGAHVLVHGRVRERGREVVREIEVDTPGGAVFHRADFASLDEVRQLGRAVRGDHDRLDVLVNNAGIYQKPEGRAVSEDRHELRFQVNYLSHSLLTRMLLPLLSEAVPSRIVKVASWAQNPLDFDGVMLERDFSESRG